MISKQPYPIKNILGVHIWAIPQKSLPKLITRLVESASKHLFMYVNAHTLNIAQRDFEYKNILNNASLVYSGGIGPMLASKILGQPLPERAPTPDFIDKVFAKAQSKKWSVYLLGTKEKSLKLFIKQLKQKFPKLDICGFHHGYFNHEEEKSIINEINSLKPTLLIVGMGTPKQEKWVNNNMAQLNARAFWVVGALFDVMAGVLPRAPKWIQNLGLEWLYRFLQEPRRLWKRYLIGNVIFILRIILSLINQAIFARIHLTNYIQIPLEFLIKKKISNS